MNSFLSKILLLIAAFALLLAIGIFAEKKQQSNSVQFVQWATKIDDRQPVTVTVTPLEFGKNATAWKFNIVLDTHSGSLDEDLTQVVSLYDGNGNAYQPILWEGVGPGGHHREGILSFSPIIPAPSYVILRVGDIGGIAERLFQWDIQ